MKKQSLFILLFFISCRVFAQGTFSGDLMMNLNFFQEDTNIGASNNPLYNSALSGSEGWLSLRYAINGFTFSARADGFTNSNLKNNTSTNTDFGIGAWNITKEMKDLTISVGSIYDQIGTGILFRSYEDRGLMIDNALMGIELKYKFTENFNMKGFVGQQKNNGILDNMVNNIRYGAVIKGINGEWDLNAGKVHLTPGFGVLDRTIDAKSMEAIAATINQQDTALRFNPRYNMYAFTAYNTLTYKNLSWLVEGSYKTHEAIFVTNLYSPLYNKLADSAGNIVYTSINYGRKGIALSLTGKRTQNYSMRTSPNEKALQGMLNWQPVVAVLRPLRLMARYTPASQEQSEMAGTANLNVNPNDVTTLTFTYTNINTLTNQKLYREAYAEGVYQGLDQWVLEGGVQYMEYNIDGYRGSKIPNYTLYGITPFAEITYKITDNKSLRMELQYMSAKQDYGSWAFALLEYNVAPKWSFTVSDMYNITPNTDLDGNPLYKNPGNHFYNFFVAYTKEANRFTLAYVKQVDGINCAGGVCRYEPAFSGVKATVTSSF